MKKKGLFAKIKGWFHKGDEVASASSGTQTLIPFDEELVPPEPPEFKTDPERVEAMFQAQAKRHGVELDPPSDECDDDYVSDDTM